MNEYFCPNPFVYLTNSLEGIVKYCCMVHRGIKDDNGVTFSSAEASMEEVWNSKDLNNIRQQMIEGKPVKECNICYKLEKMGGGSLRKDLLHEWTATDRKEQFDKLLAEYYNGWMTAPVSMEVRPSNLCNIKCRMCYPTAGVLVEKEFAKFRKLDPSWNVLSSDLGSSKLSHDKFFTEVVNNLHNLEELRFSGGEPFLNDPVFEIIAEAAKSGHSSHIDLFVNTNFTRITTEVLEDLKTFKSVTIDISTDGYKQVHEYIRSGLDWKSMEENLEKVRPYLSENFKLTTNTTVQNLNVLYIEDILRWCIEEFDGLPVLVVLENPSFLDVRNMPPAMKVEAIKRLNKLIDSDLVKNYRLSEWLQARIRSIIKSIELPANPDDINRFLYFTQTTDKNRNQDYRVSVPEVAAFYEEYYPIRPIA